MSTTPFNTDISSEGRKGGGLLNSTRLSTTPEGCLVLQSFTLAPWENPEDLVSADFEILVDCIKAAIVVPIVCTIGFANNCLNMAVFYKLGLRERINTCLFILSFVELFYLVFAFLVYGERAFALSPSYPRYGPLRRFLVENHFYGLYGLPWATGFASVVITSERCFCIYFPLRAQTVMKTKTMAIFLVLSSLLITLGFYVVGEKYNIMCIHDVKRNVTVWQMTTATSYYVRNRKLVDIFDSTLYGFCIPFIYNVIVAACSVAMTVKLKKTLSWRHQTSSAMSSKETTLIKMLICFSIMFNILSVPNLLYRTTALFVPDLSGAGKYFNMYLSLSSVCECFSFLSSTVHFFVYYCVGSKYRETLHGMLTFRRKLSRKTSENRMNN